MAVSGVVGKRKSGWQGGVGAVVEGENWASLRSSPLQLSPPAQNRIPTQYFSSSPRPASQHFRATEPLPDSPEPLPDSPEPLPDQSERERLESDRRAETPSGSWKEVEGLGEL